MSRTILHVRCGPRASGVLPEFLQLDGWVEARLDINPAVEPDIVASMTDMAVVADESMDALYSSHNLEHLHAHEVVCALAEWMRVLKPGGVAFLRVPDIQQVAAVVAEDRLEDLLYLSPAGPICAADVLWGLRSAVAAGNHFMAHKTGFTRRTLETKLRHAGFESISMTSGEYELIASAVKPGSEPVLRISFGHGRRVAGYSRWQYVRSLLAKTVNRP